VHQCAARSPVAVGERVDRLELRVSEREVNQRGQVVAARETNKISDCRRYPIMMRRNEIRDMRTDIATADP
jgi:hypothetical protein